MIKNLSKNSIFLWVLFLIGFYYLPFRLLGGFEMSMIPGDLGDSVFNMVILENGYQYVFGSIEHFWQSNFLYPFENPIALSDNLMGTWPIYALFRIIGLDSHTAFQWWILSLFALNYFISYLAFKRLSKQTIWAILAAYVFAFGFYNLNFISHLQLLPRFILPFTIIVLIEFFQERKVTSFYFFIAGTVYQFYCGMYLGFFTILAAFAFLLSYFLMYRKLDVILTLFHRSQIIKTLSVLLLAIVALMPLALPYLEMSAIVGARTYDEVLENIPSISSYFFAHPASKPWNPLLFNHGVSEAYEWWNHTNFVGILPWLSFIISAILLMVKAGKPKRIQWLVLFVFVFLFLFSKFGELSFYHYIHQLPGLSSMRAIHRIMIPLLVVLLILGILLLNKIKHYQTPIFVLLFVLVFLDNDYHLSWDVNRFPKAKSTAMVHHIKDQLQHAKTKTIAMKTEAVEQSIYENMDYFHLSCMLAAIDEDVKIVNGYSSMAPPQFETFLNEDAESGLLKIKAAYQVQEAIEWLEIPELKKWE